MVGSRRLIEAAAEGVRKVVFVSSMSAYFGTRQTYGLMKLAVERTALDLGGIVIRPGLVYGDLPGGMAATLTKIACLPVWPRVCSAKLFLVQEDELATAMATVLGAYGELSGQVVGFAHPHIMDLPLIFASLSPQRRRRISVPVPARLVMTILRLLEQAGVSMQFRSDSLLGIIEPPPAVPGLAALAEQGVEFRYPEGLTGTADASLPHPETFGLGSFGRNGHGDMVD